MRIVLSFTSLFCLFAYSYNFLITLSTYPENIIKFNKSLSFCRESIFINFEKVSCILSLILLFFKVFFVIKIQLSRFYKTIEALFF